MVQNSEHGKEVGIRVKRQQLAGFLPSNSLQRLLMVERVVEYLDKVLSGMAEVLHLAIVKQIVVLVNETDFLGRTGRPDTETCSADRRGGMNLTENSPIRKNKDKARAKSLARK